jgi:hypothetical protein
MFSGDAIGCQFLMRIFVPNSIRLTDNFLWDSEVNKGIDWLLRRFVNCVTFLQLLRFTVVGASNSLANYIYGHQWNNIC